MNDAQNKAAVAVSTRPAPLPEIVPSDTAPIRTGGKADGVIELSMPNLLPTDNAAEVYDVPVFRLRIPVRIDSLEIKVVDNGFIVELPRAGRQGMFGPDGSHHVFAGEDAKTRMLEFIGHVVGQVTYQYREVEGATYERIKRQQEGARHAPSAPEGLERATAGDAVVEAGCP